VKRAKQELTNIESKRKEDAILGLQSFPRESKDKDMAAMLVPQTKEANEKSFVIVFHTWRLRRHTQTKNSRRETESYLPLKYPSA
jgi:hypothetical protein